MNRILFRAEEMTADGRVTLADRRATHILRVLHGTVGQRVRVGVINGPVGTAEISAMAGLGVTLACRMDEPPEPPRVDVLLALPRPKVMKRLWAVLASLGVRRIILTNAERVEREYFATHWLDPVNYEPLLIEGLEQAGDTRVPEVVVRRRFRPLVEDELEGLLGEGLRLVGEPEGAGDLLGERSEVDGARGEPTPRFADPSKEGIQERAAVAVGPEGGWSEFELGMLKARGFMPVSLGWRRLRSDTACVALVTRAYGMLTGELSDAAG